MDESVCQLNESSLDPFYQCLVYLKRKTHWSYANSVEHDLTPRVAASYMGLHYCPTSILLTSIG